MLFSTLIIISTFVMYSGAVRGDEKMRKYNKDIGAKYLEDKALEPSVISLKSGMLVEILHESTKEDAKSPTFDGRTYISQF